ncbi:hypothetical protein BaRGS_00032276 [Batillaria attramentaria]|uniref:Uncharacterized protein n=1 Tax=Batillaria attramentaria TaxID=370345 RepID=A0ABD0JNS0_9CAEN
MDCVDTSLRIESRAVVTVSLIPFSGLGLASVRTTGQRVGTREEKLHIKEGNQSLKVATRRPTSQCPPLPPPSSLPLQDVCDSENDLFAIGTNIQREQPGSFCQELREIDPFSQAWPPKLFLRFQLPRRVIAIDWHRQGSKLESN